MVEEEFPEARGTFQEVMCERTVQRTTPKLVVYKTRRHYFLRPHIIKLMAAPLLHISSSSLAFNPQFSTTAFPKGYSKYGRKYL